MAVDVTLRFRAPQSANNCAVNQPDSTSMAFQRKFPASYIAHFVTNVENIVGDDAPIQENSYITVQENGEYVFRGKVRTVATNLMSGGAVEVTITALDKLQVINEVAAVYEPSDRYSIDSVNTGTKKITINGVDLTAVFITGADCYWSFNTAGNNGTYTVDTVTFTGGNTEIVVNQTIPASNTSGYFMLAPQYVFRRETPPLAITELRLYPSTYYSGGFRDVWFPAASSADAWLSDDAALASTISESMANSGTALASLKVGTSYKGAFSGTQWAKVGSEWLQYNGYRYDNADGYWKLYDVQRAMLGTSFAAHLSGVTIYPKIAALFHTNTPVKMEGYTGADWELIDQDGIFEVNEDAGSFNFNQDPLGLYGGGGDYTQIRATYAVYDEEGADALTVAGLIQDMLEANPAAFGAGWRSGYTDSCTVDVSGMPDIKVASFNVTKEMYVGDAIYKLLNETGLNKGDDFDLVSYRYDAPTDKAIFEGVAQLADNVAADRVYTSATHVGKSTTIENIRSAVLSAYTQGESTNLLASRRMWNTPGEPHLGAGPPWAYVYTYGAIEQPVAGSPGTYNLSQTPVTGYTSLNRLTDNDDGTGIGVFDDSAPSPDFGWYGWFPGQDDTTPDTYLVDNIILTFEVTGTSDATVPFGWEVYYFDDFTGSTSTTPPTTGTAKYAGRGLTRYFKPGALNLGSVTVQWVPDFPVYARAIGIYFTGYLLRSELSARYGWILKDAFVSGVRRRSTNCHIAGSAALNDTTALVGADTAAKLLDVTMGQYKLEILDIGSATQSIAQGFATLQEIQALRLNDTRDYQLDTAGVETSGLPWPDLTIQLPDGWRGVPDSMTIDYQGGLRSISGRATNYRSDVIGSTI